MFVSYSRNDQEFVRWLNDQLREEGREPWIDWLGIKPGEKWWPSILEGIDSANAFVFVLSPDSAEARIPREEIDRAGESGKRIIPVVCRELGGTEVHPVLSELNYIFLRTEEERRENLEKLFQALDTDLEYVRAHTKFLIRAREWAAHGKGTGYLLRGGLLKEADLWLAQVSGKLPAPTELHSQYILASRNSARRSQRIMMGTVASGGLIALSLALVAWMAFRQAELRRIEAEEQRTLVTKERDVQNELLWTASLDAGGAGRRALAIGKYGEGLAYLDRALELRKDNQQAFIDTASFAQGFCRNQLRVRVALPMNIPILNSALSPDRQKLAISSTNIQILDSTTLATVRTIATKAVPWSIAWNPDGQLLAAGCSDGTLQIFDATDGREILSGPPGEMVSCVRFSPDGRWVVVLKGSVASILEATTGNEISQTTGLETLSTVAFSPDSRLLAVCAQNQEIHLLELPGGKQLRRISVAKRAKVIEFSPDGQQIAIGSNTFSSGDEDGVTMLDLEGKAVASVKLGSRVRALTYSPDGRWIAAGTGNELQNWGGEVVLIDSPAGNVAGRVPLANSCTSLNFATDGRTLLVSDRTRTVRLLEIAAPRQTVQLYLTSPAEDCAFSADSSWMAVTCFNGALRVVNVSTGKVMSKGLMNDNSIAVATSPDSQFFAAASMDKTVRLYEADSGREVFQVNFPESVGELAFTPDGKTIVALFTPQNGPVRALDAATGKVRWETENGSGWQMVVSPDGRWLSMGVASNTPGTKEAKVWNLMTGAIVSRMPCRNGGSSVSFSPDGHRLAVGGDKAVRIMEVETGAELGRAELGGVFLVVHYSPGGEYLAATNGDRALHLLHPQTGKEVGRLSLDTDLFQFCFSADSQWIAVAGGSNSVRIVDVSQRVEVGRIELKGMPSWFGFSNDGKWLSVLENQKVKLFDTRWFQGSQERPSEGWKAATRVLAGQVLEPGGWLRPLNEAELKAVTEISVNYSQTAAVKEESWQHAVLQWWMTVPEKRTTSPWTEDSAWKVGGQKMMELQQDLEFIGTGTTEFGRKWLKGFDDDGIADASRQMADDFPWHPLAPVTYARSEIKAPARQELLAKISLQRLMEADEGMYGRDTLGDYGAWTARILHEELKLDVDALTAIQFALERTSPEKHSALVDLRGSLVLEVVVVETVPDGQARALQVQPGDVIVHYAGQAIAEMEQLVKLTGETKGKSTSLVIRRGTEIIELMPKGGPLGVLVVNKNASRPLAETTPVSK